MLLYENNRGQITDVTWKSPGSIFYFVASCQRSGVLFQHASVSFGTVIGKLCHTRI